LTELLIKELPQFKQQLNIAFQQKKLIELRDHAHKLHGATSYCDVPDLKHAVKELERASKLADFHLIQAKLDAVNHAINAVLQT